MPDNLLGLFLASFIVLIIPGAALLAWSLQRAPLAAQTQQPAAEDQPVADNLPATEDQPADDRLDLLSWVADSAALSTALVAVLAVWLFVLRISLPPAVVVGFYALCAAALVIALLRRWPGAVRPSRRWLSALPTLALVIVLVAWRFYQARELVLPVWVDSVHHTLVVRLILASGGLPENYQPYFDAPFYYHYGFHLIAALVTFVSRLSADQVVLWFGQVLNAAVALSVYRAAYAFGDRHNLTRRTTRAYLAALLVCFALQMPGYYLTWGRYTLLSGLLLLGPAMAAALDIWRNPRRRDAWLRLVILVAGLGVTHYFAVILLAMFLITLGLFGLFKWVMDGRLPGVLWLLAGLAVLGILLVSPWLARIWMFSNTSRSVSVVDPLDQSAEALKRVSDYFNYLSVLLGPRRNTILLSLAGVGLLASLRRPGLRLISVWALLLVMFTMPWGLRLGPFRPDHFAIILFFPAGIFLAELIIASAEAPGILPWLRDRLPGRLWLERGVVLALLAALVYWGIRDTRDIVNPVTVIATPADIEALDWVRQNTPASARFYTNSAVWMTNIYRGVDGGYWLEPYADRMSLVPPALYAFSKLDAIMQINGWNERAGKMQGCGEDFWALAREVNLTHVYVRQGTGSLQPSELADCPQLQPVYQKNGVFIYQIQPAP